MSINELRSLSLALYGKKVEVIYKTDSRSVPNIIDGTLIERKWGCQQLGNVEFDTVIGIALLLEEGVELEIPMNNVISIKEKKECKS